MVPRARFSKNVCRTYGAWNSFVAGSQYLHTGLTCDAPLALRITTQKQSWERSLRFASRSAISRTERVYSRHTDLGLRSCEHAKRRVDQNT
jgi:hypothetical protein